MHDKKRDYAGAQKWCKWFGADLVSINSETENDFLWRECWKKNQPCWIGLTEKPGTGTAGIRSAAKETLPSRQQWIWADGTTPSRYSEWQKSPHANLYNEPNNGRDGSVAAAITDERHALMGTSGTWFDRPADFQALPACEMTAAAARSAIAAEAKIREVRKDAIEALATDDLAGARPMRSVPAARLRGAVGRLAI